MKKLMSVWACLMLVAAATLANATPDHRKHGNKHRHGHHHHLSKQNHHRVHRHHHHNNHYQAGFFLGGLFIGALLNDNNRVYVQHRRNYAGPVYYRDQFGDCFEVRQRGHREIYIEAPQRFCR